MAVCALIVLRIFRKAHRQTAAQVQALPAGPGQEHLLSAGESPAEPVILRRQIAHALKSNPEQVREMFLSWIKEE
jgi:hypothetical protein